MMAASMRPIDSTGLHSAIRTALARRRGAGDTTRAGDNTQPSGRPEPSTSASLSARLAEIALDDPRRRSKVLRAFLESTVLNQLGVELAADPQFGVMLDHVQAQVEADPQLSPVIDAAIEAMTAAPGTK